MFVRNKWPQERSGQALELLLKLLEFNAVLIASPVLKKKCRKLKKSRRGTNKLRKLQFVFGFSARGFFGEKKTALQI